MLSQTKLPKRLFRIISPSFNAICIGYRLYTSHDTPNLPIVIYEILLFHWFSGTVYLIVFVFWCSVLFHRDICVLTTKSPIARQIVVDDCFLSKSHPCRCCRCLNNWWQAHGETKMQRWSRKKKDAKIPPPNHVSYLSGMLVVVWPLPTSSQRQQLGESEWWTCEPLNHLIQQKENNPRLME